MSEPVVSVVMGSKSDAGVMDAAAKNAGLLAVQILALTDAALAQQLADDRAEMARDVEEDDRSFHKTD